MPDTPVMRQIAMADRRQLYKYRGDRCGHCRRSVERELAKYGTIKRKFELNHVDPAKKHPNYDNLIRRVLSTELLDEVDKTVLLCRNCHGTLHAQNIEGTLTIEVTIHGETIKRSFKGQFIHERATHKGRPDKLSFFTDEKLLLRPYLVAVGGGEKTLYLPSKLEADFINLIMRTREAQKLEIWDTDLQPMLKITKLNFEKLEAQQDIRFPLFQSELGDIPNVPRIWVRNGAALTAEGEVWRTGVLTFQADYPKF
jgi:hypothetical protein